MTTYCVERDALLKLLLHTVKHPSSSVSGVLLGSTAGGIHVKDVVPLFHNSFSFADSTETALSQMEVYAQQQGLVLLGIYYADAHNNATDLHPAARRIADKILERCSSAFVLVLDNKKLGQFLKDGEPCPVDLVLKELNSKVGWRRVAPGGQGPKLVVEPGSLGTLRDALRALVKQQAHRLLADFDDHLDDISRDYLNQGFIQEAVSKALAA